MCAREFKSDDRPDLYAGTPPLEALKAIISHCSEPQRNIFNHAHRRVTCIVPCEGRRPVLIRPPMEDRMGTDAGKSGIDEEEHVRIEGRGQQLLSRARHELGISTGTQLEESVSPQREDRVSGLTHCDDFVHTGPTKKLMEFERKMTSVYPIKAKVISYGSSKSINTLNRRLHWWKRGIVYQHDPRHVDVLVKDFGLEHGNSVQTPASPTVTEEESEPLSQDQHHKSQVARCFPQSRLSRHNIHCQQVVPEDVESRSTEPCQVEEACQELKRERQRRQVFEYGELALELTVFMASDWAGCKETRTSSSAGVLCLEDTS